MIEKRRFILGALTLSLLYSCVGISTDITLRRNGSGTISLEYRIAGEFESLGKLDEQALPPALPVGKEDFERTVARLPGVTLRSYQSRAQGRDTLIQVKLDFAHTDGLLRFLDATGQRASLSREGGQNRLVLTLGERGKPVDGDLQALAAEALEGYSWDLRISLPAEGEFLALGGGAGRWSGTGAGRGAYSVPMGDLLSSPDPTRLEIRWAD